MRYLHTLDAGQVTELVSSAQHMPFLPTVITGKPTNHLSETRYQAPPESKKR